MFVKVFFVLQIAACSLQQIRAATTKNNNFKSNIVFPGPIQDLRNRYGTQNDTDPCEGLTYCSIKPDNYPQEKINRLFKGKFKEPVFQPSYVQTESRQGEYESASDGECDAKITYEPLYRVRSSLTSEWSLVAQAPDENFNQVIRLESCRGIDVPCFKDFHAPIDQVASCMQSVSSWEIMIYDEEKGTDKMKVHLPSCCSCYYKIKE